MIIRNLTSEYKYHHKESFEIVHSYNSSRKLSEKEEQKFIEDWHSGAVTIVQWIDASEELEKRAYEGLTEGQIESVNSRKEYLYDLWLEYRVQNIYLMDIQDIQKYAPHQIKVYAKEELEKLMGFLSGNLDKMQFRLKDKFKLSRETDFQKLSLENPQDSFKSPKAIHNKENLHVLESLYRYQTYLELIAKEGIDVKKVKEGPIEEYSFEALWPLLVELSENLIVEYSSSYTYYEEEQYLGHEIESVSGCWGGSGLKNKIKNIFQRGFDDFLIRLQQQNEDNQKEILEVLKYEAELFKVIIEDGEYEVNESEFGPREVYRFKRFSILQYSGKDDILFATNPDWRKYLDHKLTEYPLAWIEAFEWIERKIDHAINNLELLKSAKSKLTLNAEIFTNDVFVIESAKGAIQGTAFYLRGTGIITCSHCVRDHETREILDDLIIYRGANMGIKVNAIVKVDNQHIDIAIIEIESQDHFLGNGLILGNSDAMKRLDEIAVLGYPNYNFGDSGFFSIGVINAFRAIGGVNHILVSNTLVEGNSGGPAFNNQGEVIGVVVTGSSTFETASKTEKHGLIPINVLHLLLTK
jgi:S1-C subfamily serine protease